MNEYLTWTGNVGLRTGNGIVVIDTEADADISGLDLPDTVMATTGTGGRHFYYIYDNPLKNSVSRLCNLVDVRADGGQVVLPGSVHPESGLAYAWKAGFEPWSRLMAPLPDWIPLANAPPTVHARGGGIIQPNSNAVDRCISYLSKTPNAVSSQRGHDVTFRAACECVRFGLDEHEAEAVMQWYNANKCQPPWDDRDLQHKIESAYSTAGDEFGVRNRDMQAPRATVPHTRPADVLIPGPHFGPKKGGYMFITREDFAQHVLDALPRGTFYNHGNRAVRVINRQIDDPSRDTLANIIGTVPLKAWLQGKEKAECPHIQDRGATLGHAGILAGFIPYHCPKIELFTQHPVYDRDWKLCSMGYSNGIYCTQNWDQVPGSNDDIDELLVDFPWKTESDRQNFIGLLLLPMVRFALDGNCPLHMITSTLPRTGKTKLAEVVLGGVYGRWTPAVQMAGDNQEQDKRIIAMLADGDTILHLDNTSGFMDSPALASLLTARQYKGRILGKSQNVTFDNNVVLVASANNPKVSRELARRICPIELFPQTSRPELRSGFKHPDLQGYVVANRNRVIGALISMVEGWKRAGMPGSEVRYGGFERWIDVIGGIMSNSGYSDWMTGVQQFVARADPETSDLEDFFDAWTAEVSARSAAGSTTDMHAQELLDLADGAGLFISQVRDGSERARLSSFTRGILSKYEGSPIKYGNGYIRTRGRHRSAYALVRICAHVESEITSA